VPWVFFDLVVKSELIVEATVPIEMSVSTTKSGDGLILKPVSVEVLAQRAAFKPVRDLVNPSCCDESKRFFVGCGDANMTAVRGLNCILVDNKISAAGVLDLDALTHAWDSKDVIFCDAMVKESDCRTFWSTRAGSEVHSGQNNKLSAKEVINEFDRTICFPFVFAKCKVRLFCCKVVICSSSRIETVLLDLTKNYDFVFFPGGRNHNGEVYIVFCRKEADAGWSIQQLRAVLMKYACTFLGGSLLRMASQVGGKFVLSPVSPCFLPTRFSLRNGKIGMKNVEIPIDVLWPMISVVPLRVAHLRPSEGLDVNPELFDVQEDDDDRLLASSSSSSSSALPYSSLGDVDESQYLGDDVH